MVRGWILGLGVACFGASVAQGDHTRFFQFLGAGGNDHLASVDSAGDVNGDGYPDIVVGAYGTLIPPGGYVRVLSGKDGSQLHQWKGDLHFGRVVAGAGDVNNDGRGDVIVGGNDQAWVYSGKTGAPGRFVLEGSQARPRHVS